MTAAATVVVDQDAQTVFRAAEVAISPTGGWRAATQLRSDTSQYVFYRSSDGGITWSSVGTPDTTLNRALVAVSDNGDVHAVGNKTGSQNALYWKYSSGAWGASSVAAAGSVSTLQAPTWFGYDGTTFVLLTDDFASNFNLYDSTNGTTWTNRGSYSPGAIASLSFNAVFHNGYLHLFKSSGSAVLYERYNTSTHTFSAPTTAPAFQTNLSTGFRIPVLLPRHNVTGEIWAAQLPISSSGLYLFKSTDSGDNWSTVVSAETIPTILTGRIFLGVSMGSDDKLHFWGNTSAGTTVTELARDLAGTWDTVLSTVPVAGYSPVAHVAQRADGQQPNVAEIWLQLTQSNGVASPTVLTIITGVDPPPGGWSVGTIRIH